MQLVGIMTDLNARVRQTWCVSKIIGPTSCPPRTTPSCMHNLGNLGTVPTTSLSEGQGKREIQIDGLRACALRMAPHSSDLHRGARGAQGWIPYRGVSTILAQCLAVHGRIRLTYFPKSALGCPIRPSRSAVLRALVRRNESSSQRSKGVAG